MVKFELISDNKEMVIYKYYPEGKKQYPGEVGYNKITNECSVIVLSQKDLNKMYALKVFKRMREYAAGNEFKQSGMVAWY